MIRRATEKDIQKIADINRHSFSGNKPAGLAEKWIEAHFGHGDQYQYFVFEEDGKIAGYISWEVKGGFARKVPVMELEQLAVHPDFRGAGVGKKLTLETFEIVKKWIRETRPEAEMMRIFVWVKKENEPAKTLYSQVCNLGEKFERNIFDCDEVMLVGEYELS